MPSGLSRGGCGGDSHAEPVLHSGREWNTRGRNRPPGCTPDVSGASSGDPSHEGHRFEKVIRDRLEGQPGVETEIRTTHENRDIVVRTDGRVVDLGGRRGVLYELDVEREPESS